ncbi:MAG: Polar-differentiation response regulator DivK [Promethearchaeota archaeon]|nr:MAG: Polar-differentiation response regulator DivK [Candidatus Lokiarchaeota archaeon]
MKNVYIVEDDSKNMKLFRAILNKFPEVSLFTGEEGDSGLELIKNGNPDLIILDIRLPKINGIEICKELRKIERFQHVPIIAVTAYAMKGDEERILAAGFDEYIEKPIRVKKFKETINRYLSEK